MEEIDLSSLSDAEIIDMYSDIVESGEQVMIAKCGRGLIDSCCGGNFCCCDKRTGNCLMFLEPC